MRTSVLLFGVLFFVSAAVSSTALAKPAPAKQPSGDKSEPVPRMVRERDSLAGLRLGQGDAFEGELSMGLHYEYLYNDIFGFSGSAYYASFGTKITMGPLEADVKSRALTVAVQGNLHPTFVKVPDLDPFLALGLAHTRLSAKTTVPGLAEAEAKTGRTFLVGSVNARYFLDRKLSVVGSLGFGLSTFTFGMDYKF